uniref:HTH_Tnp_Tc3_1 domain-containing protein n=1 Tax=Caenorhabditis japonica TaxID=281687 RepID=A0A8R1IJQ3_CAEJA
MGLASTLSSEEQAQLDIMIQLGFSTLQMSIRITRLRCCPVLIYLHGRYKIIETSALIYILGPVCETVIENIPEKNPFCDESDVELEGFMPEVHDETDLDENHVDDDENEDAQSQTSSSTIPEEEYDFERGLQFSAVNGSESSDDEFDLETSKKPVVRRRRQPKKPSAPVAAEEDYELLQF